MQNLQKVLIAIILSIASLLFGLLIPALTKGTTESRSLDGLIESLDYGFEAFIIGLGISVILIIKVPAEIIKSVLCITASILIFEVIIIILGNLNNCRR